MFRFTIRELLLLTLVVGLGVGWWIDRWSLAKRLHQLEMQQIVRDAIIEWERVWNGSPKVEQ